MAKKTIKIEIPEQGVNESLTPEEADEFFARELEFYSEVGPILRNQLQFGSYGIGGHAGVGRKANELIQAVRQDIEGGNDQNLKAYVLSARRYTLVVGQGHIGKHISQLMRSNQETQAHWLLVLFSYKGQNNGWLDPFRALATGSPSMLAFSDLNQSKLALKNSKEALNKVSDAQKKLDAYIIEKSELFDQLEEIYREKLVVDEPAKSWQGVAESKSRTWRFWLLVFALLVASPIAAVMCFWPTFSEAIVTLASGNKGNFSLAGIAAISIPALLYAWLLKNVSRVFIQNLNLADDAEHRRALAITYLGLAENPKLKVPETERAIILNALFRPIPPHGGDEGPPAGLVDLIKGKG